MVNDEENPRPFLPPLPPGPNVLNITHEEIIKEYAEYSEPTPVRRRGAPFPYLTETIVGVCAAIFVMAGIVICIVIIWFCRKNREAKDFSKRINLDLSSSEEEEGGVGKRRALLWGARRFESQRDGQQKWSNHTRIKPGGRTGGPRPDGGGGRPPLPKSH